MLALLYYTYMAFEVGTICKIVSTLGTPKPREGVFNRSRHTFLEVKSRAGSKKKIKTEKGSGWSVYLLLLVNDYRYQPINNLGFC